ncbi:MAG: Hpt domain-containing protein, partial [Psychrobium sp.]|nr:Hpt domain-containing protein [Psychrobium sp.]
MSFDLDEDILQDFLIEAGEILELLQEQLVELENNPDDSELLNAIFRGFHTIKGGAGFMSLKELVDVCHGAENIFDLLRTGQRTVTAELMDVILEGLDAINEMFTLVKAREPLEPAEARLLEELAKLSVPEGEEAVAEPEPEVSVAGNDEMSDAEFDALLDDLNAGKLAPAVQASPSVETASNSDEMSDDEFEALLDDLHGGNKKNNAVKSAPEPN